jgi:anti-anti-sigma factor
MRCQVPFAREANTQRIQDAKVKEKKAQGKLIDEVLSTSNLPSSWHDIVAAGHSDKFGKSQGAAVTLPPQKPREGFKKAIFEMPAAGEATAQIGSSAAANFPVSQSSLTPDKETSSHPALKWALFDEGKGLNVSVSGNIDMALRTQWRELLDDPVLAGVNNVEFNLRESDSLSLAGLGLLLLFKDLKCSSAKITLCNCSQEVAQVLRWTGMDKHFRIQPPQVE